MVGSGSCFKLIACMNGNDTENHDSEAQSVPSKAQESKVSNDKQGWSFRKRSSRHRLLNNTVVLENPSYGKKESPEYATIETATNPVVQEKESVLQWPCEKPRLSTSMDCKDKLEEETESKILVAANLEDSLVIAIQTCIRGILARTAFLKLKNVVKLQAVVRGHLVRMYAVGTLRCAQAVFKVQALVRFRHLDNGKPLRPLAKDNKFLNNVRSPSIDGLFSNRFASQLLESTPKSQPINIKCDLSRPDYAWKWLERWTCVLSARSSKLEDPENRETNFLPPKDCNILDESPVSSSCGENSIVSVSKMLDLQPAHPSSTRDNSNPNLNETPVVGDFLVPEKMQSDTSSQTDLTLLPAESHIEMEQSELSLNISASEHPETEGSNFINESKSKVLTSIDPCYECCDDETNKEADFSGKREVKNLTLPNVAPQVGGSECGTELSITSTLDSLEISDSVAALESKPSTQGGVNLNNSVDIAIETQILELKPENDKANVSSANSGQLNPPRIQMSYHSSPEASPKTHIILPESQVNAGMIRENKRTRPLYSSSKKSPSNLDLGKDQKRRCSLDSSSNNGCLPSYMQPTESAKAKAQFTISPRSSPDVLQDKETVNVRKRHSLPGANGRHGSPRISRSISQAQQITKGNGSSSPHGKKWQR